MAPETAFVHGGQSAYGGIWGAYLPVIYALRDSIDILQVQLYNSGSMYGIDGNIYSQGTADFIVAMTEALVQGFTTAGGIFSGLPASKIAVALPACSNAAGGGFTVADTVEAAMNYLRGTGVQPGNYTLQQSGGYPTLRGMMTWSINWDAVSSCGSQYEYAVNFENIFNVATATKDFQSVRSFSVYPNPANDFISFSFSSNSNENDLLKIYDSMGKNIYLKKIVSNPESLNISGFSSGIYLISFRGRSMFFTKE